MTRRASLDALRPAIAFIPADSPQSVDVTRCQPSWTVYILIDGRGAWTSWMYDVAGDRLKPGACQTCRGRGDWHVLFARDGAYSWRQVQSCTCPRCQGTGRSTTPAMDPAAIVQACAALVGADAGRAHVHPPALSASR